MQEIIIIIGKVDIETGLVRILFDTETSNNTLDISLRDNNKYLKAQTIQLKEKRHIGIFTDLIPDTKYFGTAKLQGRNNTQHFNFNTNKNPTIAIVSCNSYNISILKHFGLNLSFDINDSNKDVLEKLYMEDYDIMLHIGDNIYCDELYYSKNNSYKDYSNFYKKHFGSTIMQKILRKGSHIMICDDHEFVNNIKPNMKNEKQIVNANKIYMEYQESLWSDEYEKLKFIELKDKYLLLPNIEYERIFGNVKDLNNEIEIKLESIEKNKNIYILTSKNTMINSVDNVNIDLLNILKNYSHSEMVLISGDGHCSLNSTIYYKNKKLFKNYITSGLANTSMYYLNKFKINNTINNIVNNPITIFILNNIFNKNKLLLNIDFLIFRNNSEFDLKYNSYYKNKNYLLLEKGEIIQKIY